MDSRTEIVPVEVITGRIHVIRGVKVILDRDLAHLYGVTTKRLNEQVRRNRERFPDDFLIRLTREEKEELVAKCDHLANLKYAPGLPLAYIGKTKTQDRILKREETMHVHSLDGCAPEPLAHYLKALGVLRLVAEQTDAAARGWWDGERFRLATTLSREELETFFLERYEPTPMLAPWNKGSGFYQEKDPALFPFKRSTADRFARLRAGIETASARLDTIVESDREVRNIKAETKIRGLSRAERERLRQRPEYKERLRKAEKRFADLKDSLLPSLRRICRGPQRRWMDAAVILNGEGKAQYPALFGTGGNDGRLDFTNNFFQRLQDLFDPDDPAGRPRPRSRGWLIHALWDEEYVASLPGKSVGQYMPGNAGGANTGNSPTGDSLLNPWDFILMLEGGILFTALVSRRLDTLQEGRVAAPFALTAHGAGYPSAASSDESSRGEQWMPLWSNPLTLRELRRLLAEGRAQVGARPVRAPLDMARAVARLGTARGITAFQRYGYIERNGQANLAVPLGRFRVRRQPAPLLACLDDLDAWLPRLRATARDTKSRRAPARIKIAERRLADAIFNVTQHPDEHIRWQEVILALAEAETAIKTSDVHCPPIPRLRPAWIQAADDGSAEVRLALAFGLQGGGVGRGGWIVDSIRRHWMDKNADSPSVVMHGRSGLADAVALVTRRLIEAGQHDRRRLPLEAPARFCASTSDLALVLAGRVDLDRTVAMARVFMALDIQHLQAAQAPSPPPFPAAIHWPDDPWLVLRLALLPWPLDDGCDIGCDPAVYRRLAAGDAAAAVRLAIRRLRAAGIRLPIQTGTVTPEDVRRWAAAMAFPISRATARRMLQRLDPGRLPAADQEGKNLADPADPLRPPPEATVA